MINKRKKEMETFIQMIALTNFTVLVRKGIVSSEEWEEISKDTIEAIQTALERKGDFNDVIIELQNKEDKRES